MNKQQIDYATLLSSIDLKPNGHIDLESVHPTNLMRLVNQGLIDDISSDETTFYILTQKGAKILEHDL